MKTHDHSHYGIVNRLAKQPKQSYLRDFIYGGIDGSVTTFAVVAGVFGSGLEHIVIVILGLANIFADGFSMAAANFLGTKSEVDEYQFYERLEHKHVDEEPEGEKCEVNQLFHNKGFRGDILDKIVAHLTGNRELWIKTMLLEEHGLATRVRSPWCAAIATFCAFILCGFFPLIPFLFRFPQPFFLASILTGIIFFAIGSLKSIWSIHKWYHSGTVTFLIGAFAALLAYFVGYFFQHHHTF